MDATLEKLEKEQRMTPSEAQSEVLRLQKIIDDLPEYHGMDAKRRRREYSLTKGDVILIYKIAKVASVPHVCPFDGDEAHILSATAKNITRVEKVASVVIVTSIVAGMLSGIWYLVVSFVKNMVANGGILK